MKPHALGITLAILLPALARAADEKPTTIVKSEPLAKIPAGRTPDFRLLTNHDITRVAILDCFENNHWYISVNDIVWEFYDNLDPRSAQFSPDGKQFAFFGQRNNKWFLVNENKEIRELGTEPPTALLFSPDSTRLATIHTLPNKNQQLSINGKPIAEHPKIQNPQFTPDSKQILYTAHDGGKIHIAKDDKILTTHDAKDISALHLSKDGETLTYALLQKTETAMKIDLIEGVTVIATYPAEKAAAKLTLSPDGKHVAWAHIKTDKSDIQRDGKVNSVVQGSITSLTFSPNGRHVACTTDWKIKRLLYIDGQVDVSDDIAGQATFLPDGTVQWSVPHARFFRSTGSTWGQQWDTKSSNGQIYVKEGFLGVYFNDVRTDFEKLLDVRFPETGKAVALVESPRTVHVNQKILHQLSRVTVTIEK
jgi:WD40 repeat protein